MSRARFTALIICACVMYAVAAYFIAMAGWDDATPLSQQYESSQPQQETLPNWYIYTF